MHELLERLRATSRRRICREIVLLARRQRIPAWALRLADERDLQERLYQGMYDLWRALLAPHRPSITRTANADHSLRMRQFADGGVAGLLAQANPRWMRWNPPVLEVRTAHGRDGDLHLDGRGVLLASSSFTTRTVIDNRGQQLILTYPAATDQPLGRLTALAPPAGTPSSGLPALLGHTRSAVLQTIAEHPACTTKELALFSGVAPAGASEHAAILHGAGLIRTLRHRNTALHSATALGIALLNTPS